MFSSHLLQYSEPSSLLNFPASHGKQLADAIPLYEPTGHTRHCGLPFVEYFPASQAAQNDDPSMLVYPPAHFVHTVSKNEENVPPGQATQD
jgi:hypothetical protein